MNARTSCDKLWRKRLNALSAVWPDFLDGRTVGLHKARVASRRIREALPVVAASASPAKVKKVSRKLRALTRYLGPIRELDVELALLDKESGDDSLSRPALAMVHREVAARRQALRHELVEKVPVTDVKKLIRKLQRIGKTESRTGKKARKLDAESRAVLAARLLRRSKALAAALDEAGSLYVSERIHGVRIATKKLRYALEIADETGVPRAGALMKVLKMQQERLGQLHDLEILLKHVREAEASPAVGSRVNDLTAYADTLERQCRRLHAAFLERREAVSDCVKEIRRDLVPSLTTEDRQQARVSRPGRPKTTDAAPAKPDARTAKAK